MDAPGDLNSADVLLITRADLTSEVIGGVLAVWERLKGADQCLRKELVQPFEFKPWLPYLSVSELHQAPFRVRYRLVGTEIVRFSRGDFTGKWLHEAGWPKDIVDLNQSLYQRVYETAAPVFGLSTVDWDGRQSYRFEWAILPLTTNGRSVTHCLGVDDYSQVETRPPRPISP